MQNVDKLALGLAAAIILGLVAMGLFGSSGGGKLADIEVYNETLRTEQLKQKFPRASEGFPRLTPEVRSQYSGFDTEQSMASWTFYRQPAFLVTTQKPNEAIPVHEAAKLYSAEPIRIQEDRKPGILIKGKMPEIDNAKLVEAFVEIRSSNGFSKIADLAIGSGDFEATIEDVDQGTEYQFRITTVAKSLSTVPFAADRRTLHSTEVGPVFVPFDSYIIASSIRSSSFSDGNRVPGTATITREFFDYLGMKIDKLRFRVTEPMDPKAAKASPKVPGTNWTVVRIRQDKINPATGKKERYVQLKDFDVPGLTLIIWKSDEKKALTSSAVVGDSNVVASETDDENSDSKENDSTAEPENSSTTTDDDEEDF